MTDDSASAAEAGAWESVPDGLLGPVLELNFRPWRYLDASWRESLPWADLAQRLAAFPAAEDALSRYVTEALGLDEPRCFDFEAVAPRFALLDGPALQALVFHLGIVLAAPGMERVIAGPEVRELKASLGPEGYRFALKRAVFMRVPGGLDVSPREAGEDHRSYVTTLGLRCLGTAMANTPAEVVERMLLKLPRTWGEDFRRPLASTDEAVSQCARLAAKTGREVLPQWRRLFD